MPETNETATPNANDTAPVTPGESRRAAVSRVLNLSIFFVGIGVYAAAGFALNRIAMFAEYQLTYFVVGVAVGAVGIVLWLLTR